MSAVDEPSSPMLNKTEATSSASPSLPFSNEDQSQLSLEERTDALLNRIQGKGYFSIFVHVSLTAGMNATGYFFYMLAYNIMLPKYYKCVFADPQPEEPEESCTAENICAADSQVLSWEIDWSDMYSLHNWVEKLDLMCVPGWKMGLLGSMVFVGWVITLLWLPRVSDMYGRKKIFIGGMLANFLLYILVLSIPWLDLMIAVIFCFGLTSTIRINIGFVYLMELMPKRLQKTSASIYNAQEASILVLGTLYYWFVDKHWIYFSLIGFVLQTASLVASFFVPESPRVLIELQRLEEAEQSLRWIARFNKCEEIMEEVDIEEFRKKEGVQTEKKENTGLPFSFWLKQKKIVTNLVVMSVIWLTCSFNFYLIAFSLTSFEQIYLTSILSSTSDMLAYATGGIIFTFLGIKGAQFTGFSIAICGGILILAIGLSHQDEFYFPIMVLFAKFGVSLSFGLNYISNSYLFPTLFAATAIGTTNTIARLFSAISPILAQMEEPLPMILFTSTSIVGMAFLLFLQVPKNDPDELITVERHKIEAMKKGHEIDNCKEGEV